jgi:NADH:ubiquinone oxidoreductase subunit 2 (subunit N)
MGNSLVLTMPEIILTLGALFLMMVAAYLGDRVSRVATWLAVGFLVAAALSLPASSTPKAWLSTGSISPIVSRPFPRSLSTSPPPYR